MYQNLVADRRAGGARQRPPDALARPPSWPPHRDAASRGGDGASPSGAVDLARTLRSTARHQDAPAARALLARAAGPARSAIDDRRCSSSSRDEINVKAVELIGDDSELVERRVKPLLPRSGKRLGAAIPAVMAAARDGEVDLRAGRVGDARGRDARARRGRDPGHAAARHGRRARRGPGGGHRHGADARAAGRRRRPRAASGRSRTCARTPGWTLDDRIELWIDGPVARGRRATCAAWPTRRWRTLRRGGPPSGAIRPRSRWTPDRSRSPCAVARTARRLA